MGAACRAPALCPAAEAEGRMLLPLCREMGNGKNTCEKADILLTNAPFFAKIEWRRGEMAELV